MQGTNFELMEKMPVHKAILKLSIPTVLSTIVTLIYNLTDTYFIGLLDDPVQLGAISLAFPVFMILQAMGNIFGNGAPSYISRSLGAKDYDEAKKTSSVSAYMAVIIAVFISALYFIFKHPILNVLGTSENNIAHTRNYLDIIMGFGIVVILQAALPAFLRAEGKVKEAVTGMIIGTVLNIVLDPVFILLLNQGAAGAAWATVIGNFAATIYYISIYVRGKTLLSIHPRDFKPCRRIVGEVLKIGVPSSLSQICMSFSNILLNNLAGAYGDYVITAYGVAGKLISMVFMIVFGFVSGYMPFAGYNFGAKNIKRMMSSMKFTMITATGVCLVMLIPLTALAGPFMRAFTPDSQIIDTGLMFLHAQILSVPFLGVQTTMMCTFQATGRAINSLVVNLGRQLLFYVPMLLLFDRIWKLQGLVYAAPAADLFTTLVALLIGIPMLRKLIKNSKSEAISA